ncbi:MAG TPA: hypothetical protein PLQ88_27480 [Blastocatellia bacterium]|nr:hypothetical protein [Blastocatellia bacterium]
MFVRNGSALGTHRFQRAGRGWIRIASSVRIANVRTLEAMRTQGKITRLLSSYLCSLLN